MMTDEPTACLAGYTKQANLDPAQFNLSSTLGIERLKRFTLADPRLYVLNALAAAQSAPSRRLKIHCDADDMILTADTDVDFGPYLTDLSHRLLDEKCPPAVKELATAYQAAKGLKPAFVEVSTRSKRLHWAADRGEEVRDLQGTGLRLQVREKMSLRWIRKAISYRFGQLRLGTEEDALKTHCNLTSLPTLINGHPLTSPLVLGECRTHLFSGCENLPETHPLARCRRENSKLKSLQSRPGSFPVVLALDGSLPPYLTLVVRGVNYRMPPIAKDVRAVAYVEHLRKDLSQTQLVLDSELRRVLSELGQLRMRMCPA